MLKKIYLQKIDDGAGVSREMSSDLQAAGLVVVRKLSGITDGDLPDVPITADVSTDSCNRASHLRVILIDLV